MAPYRVAQGKGCRMNFKGTALARDKVEEGDQLLVCWQD